MRLDDTENTDCSWCGRVVDWRIVKFNNDQPVCPPCHEQFEALLDKLKATRA